MRRAGRSVFRHTRRRQLQWARANWKFLAFALGSAVAYTVFVAFWTMPDFTRGLFLGFLWGGLIGTVFYILALSGEAQRRMGGHAEKWTAKALRRLDGPWEILHDVVFADCNVDHVMIGPDFVVAVETKWTSLEIDLDRRSDDWALRAVEKCTQRAHRIQMLLRSEGVNLPVVPLLVYWGPGAWDLPDGRRRVGDVRVVSGPRARSWTPALDEAADGEHPHGGAVRALAGYVGRREAYERGDRSRLRRLFAFAR